jgi:hypothetical protein
MLHQPLDSHRERCPHRLAIAMIATSQGDGILLEPPQG